MEQQTDPGTIMPLSMPASLRQRLAAAVPAGERSQFVRRLLERELTKREAKPNTTGRATEFQEGAR